MKPNTLQHPSQHTYSCIEMYDTSSLKGSIEISNSRKDQTEQLIPVVGALQVAPKGHPF